MTRCRARRIRSSMLRTTRTRSPLLWIGPGRAAPMARMRLMRPSFWELNMSTSLSAASQSGSRARASRRCPMLASFAPPSRELRTLGWSPQREANEAAPRSSRARRVMGTMIGIASAADDDHVASFSRLTSPRCSRHPARPGCVNSTTGVCVPSTSAKTKRST